MNAYLALVIYISGLLYCFFRLAIKKPISKWDFFGLVISYACFGFVFVFERFQVA